MVLCRLLGTELNQELVAISVIETGSYRPERFHKVATTPDVLSQTVAPLLINQRRAARMLN